MSRKYGYGWQPYCYGGTLWVAGTGTGIMSPSTSKLGRRAEIPGNPPNSSWDDRTWMAQLRTELGQCFPVAVDLVRTLNPTMTTWDGRQCPKTFASRSQTADPNCNIQLSQTRPRSVSASYIFGINSAGSETKDFPFGRSGMNSDSLKTYGYMVNSTSCQYGEWRYCPAASENEPARNPKLKTQNMRRSRTMWVSSRQRSMSNPRTLTDCYAWLFMTWEILLGISVRDQNIINYPSCPSNCYIVARTTQYIKRTEANR